MRDTDLFSSIGRAVGDVESFPSFEKTLLKGERNLDLESVQLSQLDKERILLSEQRDIHHFLKRQLIMFFKVNLRLRQDHLKRSLICTQENGKCEMLILLFKKLACSFNPRG